MSWRPTWKLPPVPCQHPDTCGPQQPICLPCIAGRKLFVEQTGRAAKDWQTLEEWQRESWRREAADA